MSEITIPLDELLDHLFKIENIYLDGVALRDETGVNVNLSGENGNPVVKISFQSWDDKKPDWELELDDCIDLSDIPPVYIPSDGIIRKEEDDDIGNIVNNVLFIYGRIVVKTGQLEIRCIGNRKIAITLSVGRYSSTLEVDIEDSQGYIEPID